jgi:hypothetical protein
MIIGVVQAHHAAPLRLSVRDADGQELLWGLPSARGSCTALPQPPRPLALRAPVGAAAQAERVRGRVLGSPARRASPGGALPAAL